MRNKFYQTVNKLINDNALEMYHSESLLYQHIAPYLKLTLPIEGFVELIKREEIFT